MKLSTGILVSSWICLANLGPVLAAPPEARPDSRMLPRDERLKWFREARFGMFIHWGLYAIPGGIWNGKDFPSSGEWVMDEAQIPVADYEKLAGQFNPVKFNADSIAQLAQDAGMKYLVVTSKHHDGFAMFKSNVSPYNVVDDTPFKRDVVGELAAACAKRGIKFGVYYSQALDWHEPGGAIWGKAPWDERQKGDFDHYLNTKSIPQVREILTKYGPICLIWFDMPRNMTVERTARLEKAVHELQPNTLISGRIGEGGHNDYDSEWDNTIPGQVRPGVWETPATINNTWGYEKNDQNWKTPRELITKLIDIASKGGNYLLNIGPEADGTVPQPSVDNLHTVGRWLKVNGEAIYATDASPMARQPRNLRFTQKGKTLYVHVLRWPENGVLNVPILNGPAKARLLAAPKTKLKTAATATGLQVFLPAAAPDTVASVLALELKEPVRLAPVLPRKQEADGILRLPAEDVEILGKDARLEGDEEPNIGYWTNPRDALQWKAQVDKPGAFSFTLNQSVDPEFAGAEYEVTVGGQVLRAKAVTTDGWSDYRAVSLGTVHLTVPGVVTVSVRPVQVPRGAVMNLRSVVLSPIGGK